MSNPLVSAILPTFNMGQHISGAIDSILCQTYKNFELIILDDGSTDRTADILADYAGKDSRIVVVRNPENLGLIRTLNKGLEIASGTLVARQDADNYSLPTRFAEQVSYLERHPDTGLVGTQVFIVDDRQQTSSNNIYPYIVVPPALIPWELLFYPYFAHDTIMARRNLLLEIGGYQFDKIHAEDYDLWYRLSQIVPLAMLPSVQACFYRNPEGVSQKYPALQQQTALQISSHAMSNLLTQPISLADVRLIHKVINMQILSTSEELERSEQLFTQLYTAYLSKVKLTPEEQSLLEANFTSRLSTAKMFFLATQFY